MEWQRENIQVVTAQYVLHRQLERYSPLKFQHDCEIHDFQLQLFHDFLQLVLDDYSTQLSVVSD